MYGPNMAKIANPIPRPLFRDGQVLHATDLTAEGRQHIQAVRRHTTLAHLPGVLAGLWPDLPEGKRGTLTVSPGMAIDAAGRSILVEETDDSVSIPDTAGPREVWIAYRQDPEDEDDAATARQADRYRESHRLLLHRAGRVRP